MPPRRMSAVDAQTYWMSATVPNDQFLLYGFAGVSAGVDEVIERMRDRAASCPELRLRLTERGPLRYPQWISGAVRTAQFVVHAPVDWTDCLGMVAALDADQLDPRAAAWRLHVFPGVDDLPAAGRGTVVVMQVAHALADGTRASALAAHLLGREQSVPAVVPPGWSGAALPWRGMRAARAHRQLVGDTAAGHVPAQAPSCPPLRSNTRPEGRRGVRTLVRARSQIAGPTVTVGVLAAVSAALAEHLTEMGDDTSALRAEVPMAKTGARRAHNHFGNVGVGLYPTLPFVQRTARIADDLQCRRRRAAHPAMAAQDRAFDAIPAAVLRWGVGKFDPTVRSATVTGNTVVSSVHRGPADLRFGAAPVVLTAGYPALSPMMGLVHGVHGIGDTVAISVHAAESAVGDIDAYIGRLAVALAACH